MSWLIVGILSPSLPPEAFDFERMPVTSPKHFRALHAGRFFEAHLEPVPGLLNDRSDQLRSAQHTESRVAWSREKSRAGLARRLDLKKRRFRVGKVKNFLKNPCLSTPVSKRDVFDLTTQ